MYRFRTIDRIPEPKAIYQILGTAVHTVLEDLHALPQDERSYEQAREFIIPTWRKMVAADPELRELVPDAPEAERSFFNDINLMVWNYFCMENPSGFNSAAREYRIDRVLSNGVPIKGFIDRVDVAPTGEVRVVDYKTGKKPAPQWSQSAQYQMMFYALAWWRETGTMPTQLRLMYLKVIDDLVLYPTVPELEKFEAGLADVWSSIVADVNNGDFQPRRNKLCNWCNFQSICPVFGGTPPRYDGSRVVLGSAPVPTTRAAG